MSQPVHYIHCPVADFDGAAYIYELLSGERLVGTHDITKQNLMAGSGKLFDKHAEILRHTKYNIEVTVGSPRPGWVPHPDGQEIYEGPHGGLPDANQNDQEYAKVTSGIPLVTPKGFYQAGGGKWTKVAEL